jgi:hypothetical protein
MPRTFFLTLSFTTVAIAASVMASPATAAKQVYRCEEAGRVVYADEPCADGKGRTVNVEDKRSTEDRKNALEAAKREAEFARQARSDRLADEKRASTQGAAGIKPLPTAGDEPKAKPANEVKPKVKSAKASTEAKAKSKGSATASTPSPSFSDVPTVKLSPKP